MTDRKHTIGPLSVLAPNRSGGELGDSGDRGIQTADGVLIGEAWIECPGPGGSKHIMDADAVAQLWAAAPDMYEALKGCVAVLAILTAPEAIRRTTVSHAWASALAAESKARTALSKAEGSAA